MPITPLTRSGGEGGTSCHQPFPGHPGLSQSCSQWRFSGPCAATVLSRNDVDSASRARDLKLLFFTTFSQTKPVNNLGAISLTGYSQRIPRGCCRRCRRVGPALRSFAPPAGLRMPDIFHPRLTLDRAIERWRARRVSTSTPRGKQAAGRYSDPAASRNLVFADRLRAVSSTAHFHHRFGARAHVQFPIDALQVTPDGVEFDREAIGDLFVEQALA